MSAISTKAVDTNVVDLVSSRVYPSLERSPGSNDNWVERTGGLPKYIERIAKHLHYEQGFTISRSIAVAVNTVKRWAAGGLVAEKGSTKRVNADTRAKAAKAVAEWESKKKRAKINLANLPDDVRQQVIDMANISYNMEAVRGAWNKQEQARRSALREASHPSEPFVGPYRYVKEVWSDHLIIHEDMSGVLYKVPYTVNSNGQDVTFGSEKKVKIAYVNLSRPAVSFMFDLAVTKDGRKSYKNQGKWKHGFIPVDAAAKESKAKGSPVAMKRVNRLYGAQDKVKASKTGGTERTSTGAASRLRRPYVSSSKASQRLAASSASAHAEDSKGGAARARALKPWNEIAAKDKTIRNGKRYVMSIYKGQAQLVEWLGETGKTETSDAEKRVLVNITERDAMRMTTAQIRKMLKTGKQPDNVKKILNKALTAKTATDKPKIKGF